MNCRFIPIMPGKKLVPFWKLKCISLKNFRPAWELPNILHGRSRKDRDRT